MLHLIFQKTGLTIDEFYRKPPGVQAFLLASMRVALENASKEKQPEGN